VLLGIDMLSFLKVSYIDKIEEEVEEEEENDYDGPPTKVKVFFLCSRNVRNLWIETKLKLVSQEIRSFA
jgi:hypothetical protein